MPKVANYVHEFLTGTWVTFGNNVSEEQAEAIVQAAYESGINVFDLSEAHLSLIHI